MKKILLSVAIGVVAASVAFGQARVFFNNTVSGNAITIGTPAQPGAGNPGDGLGADMYSIQLLWVPGTITDLSAFLAASPSPSAVYSFIPGSITGNPSTGAGYFDTGPNPLPLGGPAGVYTFLVQAWYSVGGLDFNTAAATGKNVGRSVLFQLNATASPTPAPNTVFPSFTVQMIPEPATLALGGLGLAALFLLRRRS